MEESPISAVMADGTTGDVSVKASVLCGSSTYEPRAELVASWMRANGFETQLVVPNFDHLRKARRDVDEGKVTVPVRPYSRNLSLARVASYGDFARSAELVADAHQPDLLYALAPPNQLASAAMRLKRKGACSVLVLDLLDLWPESLPVRLPRTPVHAIWSSMRNRAMCVADVVFLECEYYRDVLGKAASGIPCAVLRYGRSDSGVSAPTATSDAEYRMCYLGSINNIIDIDGIADIVSRMPREVTVEVLGDGERREAFLAALRSAGAEVVFHGRSFDETLKHEVMARCHFGINMMKGSVAVGISMKSVDYLEAGLPILNSLSGDIAKIIETRGVGLNVNRTTSVDESVFDQVASRRKEARAVYEELFSEEAFNRVLDTSLGSFVALAESGGQPKARTSVGAR